MMEALSTFETSIPTRAIQRNIPEDGILQVQPYLQGSNQGIIGVVCFISGQLGFQGDNQIYKGAARVLRDASRFRKVSQV
jgi:hypothetical protein